MGLIEVRSYQTQKQAEDMVSDLGKAQHTAQARRWGPVWLVLTEDGQAIPGVRGFWKEIESYRNVDDATSLSNKIFADGGFAQVQYLESRWFVYQWVETSQENPPRKAHIRKHSKSPFKPEAVEYFDGHRGIYIGGLVQKLAAEHGWEGEQVQSVDDENYVEAWVEAEQYLNTLAPEGFAFGSSSTDGSWGLYQPDDYEENPPKKTKRANCQLCGRDGELQAVHLKNEADNSVRWICSQCYKRYDQAGYIKPRSNPLTVIGKRCILIETEGACYEDNMGRVLGLEGGRVFIEGNFPTSVAQERILAVKYLDDEKAVAEGLPHDGRPWLHDFKTVNIKVLPHQDGILLVADEPLWEMR